MRHRGHKKGVDQSTPHLLDVLVLNAADLLDVSRRKSVLADLDMLLSEVPHRAAFRGPWLLVATHSPHEHHVIATITPVLLRRCQGVIAVTEGHLEWTARAAFSLHQLHIPNVADEDRAACIMVYGSDKCRRHLLFFQRRREKALRPVGS